MHYSAVTYPRLPAIAGLVVAGLLLCIGITAMLALIWADGKNQTFASIDWARLAYSLKSAGLQASLSTFGALIIAIPASIAIARRNWPWLKPFVMVISLAMVLPTTVAATGLLAVWGRNGLMADLCAGFCGSFSIYGLHGVVIAHMMLNIPLMIRVFTPLLKTTPAAQWRLSSLFGLTPFQRFIHIEWRAIKPAVASICALVFLLCFTSFALVLMLGGGPKVTTLEVEIYTAIRFDFNLAVAAGLSLIQFALAAVVVAIMAVLGTKTSAYVTSPKNSGVMRSDLKLFENITDLLVLTMVVLLAVLPMVMVAINGITPALITLLHRPSFWSALSSSLMIASLSAVVVTLLAFMMAVARSNLILPWRMGASAWAHPMKMMLDAGIMLYLVIPSIVLGTASFIALRQYGDVFFYAFMVVIAANILLSLPFAVRLLERRLTALTAQHDQLAAMLGINGLTRLRILTLPPLKRDLGVIMGLTAALSIGDLGVIALFAHDGFKTLPWMLYQLSGNYAADEAAGLAFILMLLTVVMFIAGRGVMQLLIGNKNA